MRNRLPSRLSQEQACTSFSFEASEIAFAPQKEEAKEHPLRIARTVIELRRFDTTDSTFLTPKIEGCEQTKI